MWNRCNGRRWPPARLDSGLRPIRKCARRRLFDDFDVRSRRWFDNVADGALIYRLLHLLDTRLAQNRRRRRGLSLRRGFSTHAIPVRFPRPENRGARVEARAQKRAGRLFLNRTRLRDEAGLAKEHVFAPLDQALVSVEQRLQALQARRRFGLRTRVPRNWTVLSRAATLWLPETS
jgi:hypothetical protein